ncbi:glycosyltransferase family protein [Paenibacillus dendritiformis]|uniref:Type 12 methyltransferase n=1 Tax=Paenibacillus dendritiformis C454 TaxID=1131935 RepID=H3S9L8_9BACL|nr:glycosyltransferase [Paenibacillus dendritiformis]EHQ64136.1 type 12 methyltransferase [Paenibacillus dendritiformis C454]CAH8773275.1 glycosyltransferase [Paenibacillus dendritiformis]
MDINYIKNKIEEIHRVRNQILGELKDISYESLNKTDYTLLSKKFKRSFQTSKKIKIGCIMDDFTYHSLSPECNLFQVTPNNWRSELEQFQADMFFLESAWSGINGLWNQKITNLSDDILDLLHYCKKNSIPIVFWNKEDPFHFNDFIHIAKLADFVFTTDIDCIINYKTILRHDRIFFMPFAAQPKYHNPIEVIHREDKFCFAGAYYQGFSDRVKDFETFINIITRIKDLDIYDRNFNNKKSKNKFPRQYKRYIKGYLKTDNITKAYKGYMYNINMNSVKQSQSMCARRIFELLACNTITVSNYSRAIRNLFGDLVVCTDDGKRLYTEVKKLEDSEYLSKFRLLGLRKVLSEHTYKKRLEFIINKVYEKPLDCKPIKVIIIAQARTKDELERLLCNFSRQKYKYKKICIVTNLASLSYCHFSEDIILINKLTRKIINNIKEKYSHVSFFSTKDYYGENYITDYVLALNYSNEFVFSKESYFFHRKDGFFERIGNGGQYKLVQQAAIRRAFINLKYLKHEELMEYSKAINEGVILETCLSLDEYNYCMDFTGSKCPIVDDLVVVDTGKSVDSIYEQVENIQPLAQYIEENASNNVHYSDATYFIKKSKILVITYNYPDYSDFQCNAFIHSRVEEYKNNGLLVDVFRYGGNCSKRYSEFCGIDIIEGNSELLNNILLTGGYEMVLIHSLSAEMWDAVKNSIRDKKILVWLHGTEFQPNRRRRDSQYFNKAEAMSAGLVPVVANDSAVPESSDCGILVAKDYKELANSIEKLYHQPKLFMNLSRNASKTVRVKYRLSSTILKEIELITSELK